MDLPVATLYLHHLRMIERLVSMNDANVLEEGVRCRWTVTIAGVEWGAATVDGLLASVPDPRARIDAIRYRSAKHHIDDAGRITYEYPPWDETSVTLDEAGGSVSHEIYASGENIHEQMAWVERQVQAICVHCKPTRDGVAALWDRPLPWMQQAWDGIREPTNVGRSMWAVLGGVIGAALTRLVA